jgi:hypothetical protein
MLAISPLSPFSQIALSKHFDEFLMPVQGFKLPLALHLQSPVKSFVAVVQAHVNVVTEPAPAAPFVGGFPPDAVEHV